MFNNYLAFLVILFFATSASANDVEAFSNTKEITEALITLDKKSGGAQCATNFLNSDAHLSNLEAGATISDAKFKEFSWYKENSKKRRISVQITYSNKKQEKIDCWFKNKSTQSIKKAFIDKSIKRPLLSNKLKRLRLNDFSGVWASNCNNSSNQLATLWITRATNSVDALYQVGHPRSLSEPTPIIGDDNFEILSKDKIKYKNKDLVRYIKSINPSYSSITTAQIENHILGKWSNTFHLINGKKKWVKNKAYGLPDMEFLDSEYVNITNVNETRKIPYKITKDKIIAKFQKDKLFKVLLINETELHITFEHKPSAGVVVFNRQD